MFKFQFTVLNVCPPSGFRGIESCCKGRISFHGEWALGCFHEIFICAYPGWRVAKRTTDACQRKALSSTMTPPCLCLFSCSLTGWNPSLVVDTRVNLNPRPHFNVCRDQGRELLDLRQKPNERQAGKKYKHGPGARRGSN